MKVLFVLYSDLLKRVDLQDKLEKELELVKKLIGPDSVYATITSEMKHFFDIFPDLVFIRNDKGTFIYGAYKGLRKLRGNAVLLIDGGVSLTKHKLAEFIRRGKKNILCTGLALIKLVDLDYIIRTMERYKDGDASLSHIMEEVKREYGIDYEMLQEV
ncbi:hypothetical protein Thal_0943 [Thermocrinis albus DSM 14484]|uniref:Uncharacterized protein n=1 Tax=Thermocrinis albus (strain DSM 14484 / JCM 11386 / HI 11/12) TaxID=638303 RepID=D3SLE5_THEAH|nr:hypothetical protein [Thermocrinis albus]ADC89575.1 hypothetical protein Thal_0943 [Thermocrinis albus DSM 14484]